MTYLDLDGWPRRQHFDFFRRFDEPFFGICVRIDCTEAWRLCKAEGHSFFLYYLHKCLSAVNHTETFRYRIVGERVAVLDRIHASATIGRGDGSFDFSYIPYREDFTDFTEGAEAEIARIQQTKGLNVRVAGNDVIHFSATPWLDFTQMSHARGYNTGDSCPKISVGKAVEAAAQRTMAVSIHAHHGLMDGVDVARFVDAFQKAMG